MRRDRKYRVVQSSKHTLKIDAPSELPSSGLEVFAVERKERLATAKIVWSMNEFVPVVL